LVAAGIAFVSLAIGGVVAMMANGGNFETETVGVTRIHDQLTIVSCSRPIESVDLSDGSGPSTDFTWSARTTGPPSISVPLADSISGYEAVGTAPNADSERPFTVQSVKTESGLPIIATILVFVPSKISEGFVTFGSDERLAIDDWRRTKCGS
jgi:hypothetical protein